MEGPEAPEVEPEEDDMEDDDSDVTPDQPAS
jgi:hypothetical protein